MKPAHRSSPDDRAVKPGKELRSSVPRGSLETLAPRPDDFDAVGRLMEHDGSRVASLLGLRYKRMLEGPSSFLRGSALLMADDLARGTSTGLEVQLSGDAHLSNFGVFLSSEREMVFDVNDFDESSEGPFEWDVKRLATSLVIASHELGHDAHQQSAVALSCAREYRKALALFSSQRRLDVWYATLDVKRVVKDLRGFFSDAASERINDVVGHLRGVEATSAQHKVLHYGPLGPSVVLDPPRFSAVNATDASMTVDDVMEVVAGYANTLSNDRQVLLSQFRIREVVRHVVGVGSVGTECYAVLMTGRDDHDPFFLQIKQAQASVLTLARGEESSYEHGERVVRGQKLMQATSDPFLGWHTLDSTRSFYVRQLFNNRASVNVSRLDESGLVAYGRLCSWALARAHARYGRGPEIAGYLGSGDRFEKALATFALAYREQNQRDYEALRLAAKEGRITVAT